MPICSARRGRHRTAKGEADCPLHGRSSVTRSATPSALWHAPSVDAVDSAGMGAGWGDLRNMFLDRLVLKDPREAHNCHSDRAMSVSGGGTLVKCSTKASLTVAKDSYAGYCMAKNLRVMPGGTVTSCDAENELKVFSEGVASGCVAGDWIVVVAVAERSPAILRDCVADKGVAIAAPADVRISAPGQTVLILSDVFDQVTLSAPADTRVIRVQHERDSRERFSLWSKDPLLSRFVLADPGADAALHPDNVNAVELYRSMVGREADEGAMRLALAIHRNP